MKNTGSKKSKQNQRVKTMKPITEGVAATETRRKPFTWFRGFVPGSALVLCCWWTLAAAPPAEPLKVVVDENVPVVMRDGAILRANVCRPDRGGPYPVLLTRTPYGKGKGFAKYVEAGYIVVSQDARGRYASEGTFESFVRFQTHDAEDGYDSVQWAAKLPNSTGKVGTFGTSYSAFYQWRLAPLRPPALVVMSAHSIPGRYTDLEGPGTIRPGRRLYWWAMMGEDIRRRAAGVDKRALTLSDPREIEKWILFVPWLQLPQVIFEHETDAMHYWLKHPHLDPWKLEEGCREVAVPNFDVTGWHDHCNGDVLLYRSMAASAKTEIARKQTRILIGPWGHSTLGKRRFDKIDFGPEAEVDLVAEDVRWFDYWLKGKPAGIAQERPVRIFVMGDNRWRGEQEWPLSRARNKTMFLAGGGRANTPAGDGKLLTQLPKVTGSDHYGYDPSHPVPTLFAQRAFTAVADQRRLADRRDILVYQSEPLQERLEVTGNPIVELYAATSAPDTDWFVRLIAVEPDGLARDVCMGMVRARYRSGLEKPALLPPGEIVRYTIRMGPTANAFLPGHRIRLDVTSSDFPNYDRNHNTAADQNADAEMAVAQQSIHHGGRWASKIVLPVVGNN